MYNLTTKEIEVIKGLTISEYNLFNGHEDSLDLAKKSEDLVALSDSKLISMSCNIDERSVPGVLGSLVKKNIIEEEDDWLYFTDEAFNYIKKNFSN